MMFVLFQTWSCACWTTIQKAVSHHSTPCSTISSRRRQMKEPTPVHLHPPRLPWTTLIQPPLLALFLALVCSHNLLHTLHTHSDQVFLFSSNTVFQLIKMINPLKISYPKFFLMIHLPHWCARKLNESGFYSVTGAMKSVPPDHRAAFFQAVRLLNLWKIEKFIFVIYYPSVYIVFVFCV